MNTPIREHWLVCTFLIVTTLLVFWPVRTHEFVKYDDDKYVTDNRHVQSGLNWQSVHWAFTAAYASNWHPITWLSHIMDCRFFGLNARAHHLVNLLFHILNALLLFTVLKRMTRALWASAFVAAVFALHPLHVESVAWVAERKDVLSTFFWLLTMWAYVRYAEKPGFAGYLLTVVFFVLGLMAKPMLVTLPFVLLLLDYWPLERMQPGEGDLFERKTQKVVKQKSLLYLAAEKMPFFALSVISSIITFCVQRRGGAMSAMELFSLKSRIANAVVSYISYIEKMVWPSRLAVLYPHPAATLSLFRVLICGLLLVLMTIYFIYLSRRYKFLAVGWLWYLGTLVPVIGLVQVGSQAMADRYTYIPLTGLFIIIAWGISELARDWHLRNIILALLAAVVLLASAVCTRLQLGYWKNSVALFQHTLDVTRNNFVMHNNYANLLKGMGKTDEAMKHLNRALELKPDSAEIHINLGNFLGSFGKIDEAIEHYKKAIALKPDFSEGYYGLAAALARQGKTDEAIVEYYQALRFEPDNADALSNLGFELAKKGRLDEAVECYNKAIALAPGNVVTHGRLGLALASVGKTDEAIKQFQIVLKERPDDEEMYCNRGILLQGQGKIGQAIEQYRRALQIKADCLRARQLLDAALAEQKNR